LWIGVLNAAMLNTLLPLLLLSRLGTRDRKSFSGTRGAGSPSTFWLAFRVFCRRRHQNRKIIHSAHTPITTGIIPRPSFVPKDMPGGGGVAKGVSMTKVEGNEGGIDSGGVELSVIIPPVDEGRHGDCCVDVEVDVLSMAVEVITAISSART
jgi:hypothetical protein